MALTSIWTGSDQYLCDPELAQAFHMARVLGMPLLIEGEPGTGKTELPIQFSKDNDLELFIFPVGSKSNLEQELPTAFKGRCIYHYISFPDPQMMRSIMLKHFPDADDDLIEKCIGLFYQLRNLGLERAPSTRELLNWFKYLKRFSKSEALAKIGKREGMGILVKTEGDLKRVKKA